MIMRLCSRRFFVAAIVFLMGAGLCQAAKEGPAKAKSLRILFVGNSYTYQSWKALEDVFAGHHIEKHAKGGARLSGWAKDEKLTEKIKTGKWDYVVLQDQSQVPSLTANFVKSFMDASATLDAKIRGAKAKTVFFMTWGRRDGDKKNKNLNPTFEKMQARLSASYRAAATKLKAQVAPVGEVYGAIKKKNPDLFPKLYKGDGSHPAGPGAYAVAYTFHATIVGIVPTKHAVKKGGDLPKVAAAVAEVLALNKKKASQ
jgi:hypothetical protein